MGFERSWERLLEHLAQVGDTVQVAPGRIRVAVDRPDGVARTVEVVMTPDNWDDMSGVAWGDVDGAAAYVQDRVRASDQPFLVYDGQYDVQDCPSPEIPEDPEEARMRELMKQHPKGIPGGRWVAYNRDGNVTDEFRSHPQDPPASG